MTSLERVLTAIRDAGGFSSPFVEADTTLLEIADDESFTLVALLAWLEQEFDVEFGQDADWLYTVRDVADFLDGKRQEMRLLRPAESTSSADVCTLLRPHDNVDGD